MDELKNGLSADRLSCHGSTELAEVRFMANFFRLLLFTCSYNLTNAFRRHPLIPADLQTGQPDTRRKRVIKVAAEIIVSARRIVVRLARNWPHLHAYFAVVERANRFGYTSSA